jgi:gliding motility-associated-like protein
MIPRMLIGLIALAGHIVSVDAQCFSGREHATWAYRQCMIDFSNDPPLSVSNAYSGFECYSQWCDADGELLLYLNGTRVFNRNHQLMPGGNLGIALAASSTHGIILPWPGADSLYYVIAPESNDSHTGPKTLYYAVVDMSLAGGLGAVSVSKQTLLTMSSERVAAVRHCNGRDWWLLGRSADSNTWYAWPITPDGIQPAVVSQLGYETQFQTGGNCASSAGQLHISPDGRRVAIAYARNLCLGGTHFVIELLDFSAATGTLMNASTVVQAHLEGYSVQFSPDNNKLYYSRHQGTGGGGELYQVDLLSADLTTVQIFPPSAEPSLWTNAYSGLATGPDGRIYASDYTQPWLHVIADPNEPGEACNYIWQGLDISPGVSGLGLPTMPSGHWRPHAPWLSGQRRPRLCDTLTYTVSHTCSADTWTEWRYLGANTLLSEDADSVRIAFNTPGTDTLIATRHSPCAVVSDTLLLQVAAPPALAVTLTDSLLCPGATAMLAIAPAATTRRLLLPDGTVMSALPDTLTLGPITADACYTLTLGAEGACDTTLSFCLRALPTYATYDTLTRCVGEAALIHGVAVSEPGDYAMSYTAANGCDSLSSVTLHILSTPDVVADAAAPTCPGLSDGYILLDAVPGLSYAWSDGAAGPERLALPAGTYTVTVSIGAACDTVLSFTLTAPPEVSVTLPAGGSLLAGDSLQLQPLILPPGAYTYTWTPSDGLSCADCPDPVAAPAHSTAYTLVVTDLQGCTYVAGTLIEVREPQIEPPIHRLYFPTAFSPNGDGINDTWQVQGSGTLWLERMEVYDRWGGLVWSCQGDADLCAWDGHTRGKAVSPGVYTWLIVLHHPDGTTRQYQGEVAVVR